MKPFLMEDLRKLCAEWNRRGGEVIELHLTGSTVAALSHEIIDQATTLDLAQLIPDADGAVAGGAVVTELFNPEAPTPARAVGRGRIGVEVGGCAGYRNYALVKVPRKERTSQFPDPYEIVTVDL